MPNLGMLSLTYFSFIDNVACDSLVVRSFASILTLLAGIPVISARIGRLGFAGIGTDELDAAICTLG